MSGRERQKLLRENKRRGKQLYDDAVKLRENWLLIKSNFDEPTRTRLGGIVEKRLAAAAVVLEAEAVTIADDDLVQRRLRGVVNALAAGSIASTAHLNYLMRLWLSLHQQLEKIR